MGMARRPGEELAPRGRTGYSDAELVRAEGELFPALSAARRHGRPPGVSALPCSVNMYFILRRSRVSQVGLKLSLS